MCVRKRCVCVSMVGGECVTFPTHARGDNFNDTGATAQYEWSCSPYINSSDGYLLPNIDIGDHMTAQRERANLDTTNSGLLYIFPVPSMLNCSGTVTHITHCYEASFGDLENDQRVFNLVTLEREENQFTITRRIRVRSTARNDICTASSLPAPFTQYTCCDTFPLDKSEQFTIPALNFALGVAPNSSLTLLSYDPTISANERYLVEQYRIEKDDSDLKIAVGKSITVMEQERSTNEALLLFQLLLRKSHYSGTSPISLRSEGVQISGLKQSRALFLEVGLVQYLGCAKSACHLTTKGIIAL